MGCFTLLYLYIYTLLVIYKPTGSQAVKVSISQNITGLIGNNDIPLTCSFINEADRNISRVEFFAKNKTDEFDDVKAIAILKPDEPAKLISSGKYLIGRVTLTNITKKSINATITFHVLKCEDEKDYMCKCYYTDMDGAGLPTEKSPPTRLSVHTTSSKPDSISGIIVVSSKTETPEYTSSIYNTSLSTKRSDISTFWTSSIETVTTKHLQSIEKLSLVFREGEMVMFICTGNIGNPPGKLIWQKTFPQGKKPVTYSNETTDIEEIPGTCSFKGTSHMTVKISAEDMKAKISCFEESQVNVQAMYLETEPFDVHFQVNHVDINKYPNQKQYDPRTDNITLTCKGNGNPQPTYKWFKEGENNTILSNQSFYVIENVIRNNSGVYICEVYNVIDHINYKKSNSVEIYIDELPLLPDSALMRKSVIEIVISVICAALFVVTCVAVIKYCCFRSKRKEKEESSSRKFSIDAITFNPEYTSVILTNNTTAGEKGETLVVYNGRDDNKSKTKQEDLLKTVDVIPNMETSSFHTPVYAIPSDALQAQNGTCKIPHGMTSFKVQEKI